MKKILIIDDNELNLKILSLILTKSKYKVDAIVNPKSVIDEMAFNPPDLILLDISMPDIDGFKLCSLIKHDVRFKNIPVIFVTMHSNAEFVVKAFEYGAVDYITKPFNAEEVKVRVANHLRMQDLQNKLTEINQYLEQKIQEQIVKISDAQMETIYSLAKLAQSRDDDTGTHLERVRRYCYLIASRLADNSPYQEQVDEQFVKNIFNASPLHDIGKVGIPDSILLSPHKFTPEEFDIMKTHTTIGAETLSEVNLKFGDNSFIRMGTVIARSHHERWDGRGYPDGLAGEEIPLSARIMAIADVYDALTSKRAYKEAFSQEKSVEIIREGRGTQFDPVVTDVFLELAGEFANVRISLNEELVG